MSKQQTPAAGSALARHRWRAEEHRIRDDYLAAVEQARRQYDMDTAPARAAYDHAERAAWMIYMTAGRANWTAYTQEAEACAPPLPPVNAPLAFNSKRPAPHAADTPQPAFTPTSFPEGDQL